MYSSIARSTYPMEQKTAEWNGADCFSSWSISCTLFPFLFRDVTRMVKSERLACCYHGNRVVKHDGSLDQPGASSETRNVRVVSAYISCLGVKTNS